MERFNISEIESIKYAMFQLHDILEISYTDDEEMWLDRNSDKKAIKHFYTLAKMIGMWIINYQFVPLEQVEKLFKDIK